MSCITEKTEDKTEKQGRSVFLITGRTLTLLTALRHLQRIHYNAITLIKLRLANLQCAVPKIPFLYGIEFMLADMDIIMLFML